MMSGESMQSVVVGSSVEGRPIVAERFGEEGPVVFVMCGIHGNERSSVVFGERLRARLLRGSAESHGVQVLLVQSANPDGVAQRRRTNARGIDLNRNFAASNFEADAAGGPEPESEPETRALRRLIEATEPAAILAIHCCEPLFDWDGPAEELAETMAAAMSHDIRFPVERLGANPGSLGSWAGHDLAIPTVTVEFDCHGPTDIRRQLAEVHESVDAAFKHVASTMDPPPRLTLEAPPANPRGYHSTLYDEGIRVERIGNGERQVLLLGCDAENNASAIAEHIRRRLLAVPPDRHAFSLISRMPNADALQLLLEDGVPHVAILVEPDDEGDSMTGFGLDVPLPKTSAATGAPSDHSALLRTLRTHPLPHVRVGVRSEHADGRNADDIPTPNRFSDPLLHWLLNR